MRKIALMLMLVVLIVCLQGQDYTPNELIIKTISPQRLNRNGLDAAAVNNFIAAHGALDVSMLGNSDSGQFFVIRFPQNTDISELCQTEIDGVEYIEPNYLSEFLVYPDDPYLYQQYFDLVQIPEAWNITTGRKDILVAVVDSGTHYDHPDLQQNLYVNQSEIPSDVFELLDSDNNGIASNMEIMEYFEEQNLDLNADGSILHNDVLQATSPLMNGIDDDGNGYIDDLWGWDFTDAEELANMASGDYLQQDNDPEDEYNHGTHVAGIIGATADNGEGISGICWDVSILTVRAGFKTADGLSGVLQDDDAAAGIIYAADMGADVINLSWGDNVYAAVIADACEYAYNQGCIVVVSAGNTASSGLMYPARLAHTISVGAVDDQGERYWQSSFGPYLDIMAPGVSVMSCFNVTDTYYEQMSGTSMSAPYISGAVALLLSWDPGLEFEEVRARLAGSAIEGGEPGRDDYYGNGTLDCAALLGTYHTPCIEINYPQDNEGIAASVAINGTITSDNFSKYSVMYTLETIPAATDWFTVEYPHVNQPNWKYNEVIDGEIAWFDIPDVDGTAIIRVEVVTITNEHYEYQFDLHIDQTPPQLDTTAAAIQTRYFGGNLINYFKLSYDEAVELQVVMHGETGEECSIFSNTADSLHYLAIPLLQQPGLYSAEITATNIAGLTQYHQYPNIFEISRSCLDYSSWEYYDTAEAQVCLPQAFCYDNDNRCNDVISMELDEQLNRDFYLWEDNGSYLQQRSQIEGFADNFWMHSIGNIEPDHFELVGVEANTAAVYSINNGYAEQDWTLNNSYGGSFVDYDADGVDDLALIQNITLGSVTYRVLGLHKKFGDSWQTQYLIYNSTATYSKNEFLNKVECADLNENGRQEIVTCDNDGDVIIYEQPGESMPFEQLWTDRLPTANGDYLTSGRFRSADAIDFCAGAWNYDSKSAANTFSCFVFYAATAVDSIYTAIDTLYFDEYQENNAITCCDLDGDGDDEVILALDPNLYIVDYIDTDGNGQNDSFVPVWKGSSKQNYPNTISAVPAYNAQPGHIIANSDISGETRAHYLAPLANYTGPQPVEGFQARVLGSSSVLLTWLANPDAEEFHVFRKEDGQSIYEETLIAITAQTEFTDLEVDSGAIYNYRITCCSSLFSPAESIATPWQTVTPAPVPALLQPVAMISPWNVEVLFDQPLANSAVNSGHYSIDQGIGKPASVNHIHQNSGVLLTFRNAITQQNTYTLKISGLETEAGIIMPDTDYQFTWQEDTLPPEIDNWEIIADDQLQLNFNEPLEQVSAENINNYFLTPPVVDDNNEIAAADADENKVILSFKYNIKTSNQPYYLSVINLADSAGNIMNNQGSQIYFTLTDRTLENMVTYPNPFETGKQEEFRFAALPAGEKGELWIYDITGVLVYNTSITPRTELENYCSWKGTNNSGDRVSSGMYIYIMQIGEQRARGKIAVIN